jgi:hypothetical protein
LKSFGKKINLYQIKGWAPKALNWAIKRISSEFTAFTDADCIVDKNWLKELMSGFESEDILGVAGYCGTPKNVKGLQRIIGMELKDRFKHFPKYMQRAPTMNLCIKTGILKKLKFDEKLQVAFETDLGYRINKYGKIFFNEKAMIYHYHRATWKGFYKQQYTYAKFLPYLYFTKHFKNIRGDAISKTRMLFQIIFIYIAILGAILSFLNISLIYLSVVMAVFILSIYLFDIVRLSKNLNDALFFFSLFLVRNVAWNIGVLIGIFNLLR